MKGPGFAWSCLEPGCGAAGQVEGEIDWLENDATRHSASHARGPFDRVGQILIDELGMPPYPGPTPDVEYTFTRPRTTTSSEPS